jgi:multidrug efflux system membrane fusion protein
VQAGSDGPILTTVVADQNVYVDFEVDDRTYFRLLREDTSAHEKRIPVRLNIPESNVTFDGYIHSFDNRINPATGTIRARALFVNENSILLSGMSVSISMGISGNGGHILLTERAIGTDQNRKFVYVIDDESRTAYREVNISESVSGRRVILSGLMAGDVVVTEGILRIRPGMLVTRKDTQENKTTKDEPSLENLLSNENEDKP